MKKEEFRQAVTKKLRVVPLETRKTWASTDLYAWRVKVSAEDTYLRWDRSPGDAWQHVNGMCADLIGGSAVW